MKWNPETLQNTIYPYTADLKVTKERRHRATSYLLSFATSYLLSSRQNLEIMLIQTKICLLKSIRDFFR